MKTNKFQDFLDIKRSELLDKISEGWTVRRKDWPVGHHSYGPLTVSASMTDLLCNDWEGHPPTPKLKRKLNKLYLEDVIVLTKDNPDSYFREELWPSDKFIKWDSDKKIFVHVFHYPEICYDTSVSFAGNQFNTQTFEQWFKE